MKKYADGGMADEMMNRPMPPMAAKRGVAPKRPMPRRRPPLPPEAGAGDVTPPPGAPGMPAMKKGGSVSARADGIAKRGRTNCKMY